MTNIRSRRALLAVATLLGTATIAQPANASLDLFQAWFGSYGLTTDGGGSTGSSYSNSAFVPSQIITQAPFFWNILPLRPKRWPVVTR